MSQPPVISISVYVRLKQIWKDDTFSDDPNLPSGPRVEVHPTAVVGVGNEDVQRPPAAVDGQDVAAEVGLELEVGQRPNVAECKGKVVGVVGPWQGAGVSATVYVSGGQHAVQNRPHSTTDWAGTYPVQYTCSM